MHICGADKHCFYLSLLLHFPGVQYLAKLCHQVAFMASGLSLHMWPWGKICLFLKAVFKRYFTAQVIYWVFKLASQECEEMEQNHCNIWGTERYKSFYYIYEFVCTNHFTVFMSLCEFFNKSVAFLSDHRGTEVFLIVTLSWVLVVWLFSMTIFLLA